MNLTLNLIIITIIYIINLYLTKISKNKLRTSTVVAVYSYKRSKRKTVKYDKVIVTVN